MKEFIDYLIKNDLKVSTMESCTGGFIASSITNIEGSSKVFNFGAITYSNEYKIKMGVSEDLIYKYGVYSMEVANNMAKTISNYTNSTFGIGITGKMSRVDENNLQGLDDEVFLSLYDSRNNKYYNKSIRVINKEREKNKEYILDNVIDLFRGIYE